jgi:hypothetical protein
MDTQETLVDWQAMGAALRAPFPPQGVEWRPHGVHPDFPWFPRAYAATSAVAHWLVVRGGSCYPNSAGSRSAHAHAAGDRDQDRVWRGGVEVE